MTPLKTRLCRTLTSRPVIMAFNAMLSYFALVILCELALGLGGDTVASDPVAPAAGRTLNPFINPRDECPFP